MIRRLLASLLLLIVGIGAVACGGEGARGGANIQVIEPRLVRSPSGRRAFSGTLVNAGRQPVSIAQVDVALYDDSGSPVETVRIEVKDVSARDSVDFSGTIDSDKSFHQAQVKSILTP
ncbi:FxLYD domain-containing protein [Salinibacter sp. 10B]|uniref:FxLYD domain-containing protein n=1 Tax=Salinibacter sp. 10B TaxID=1923971 RepID=UPI0011AFEE4F|nr:FxLYD domain-containing protein [Salinibacter sp. 10B]